MALIYDAESEEYKAMAAKVGEINGLSVIDMGDCIFGKPSKITANTFIGKAGIVNI